MKKQEIKTVTTMEGKLKSLEKEIRRIEKNVPSAAIKEKLSLAANGQKLLEQMSAKEEKAAEEYVKKYMVNSALVADPPLHWWFLCLKKPFTAPLVRDGHCVKVPYHESLFPSHDQSGAEEYVMSPLPLANVVRAQKKSISVNLFVVLPVIIVTP